MPNERTARRMNSTPKQPENEIDREKNLGKGGKSELRRAIVRMSSNYIRLFASVVIGLMFVRIILEHWGNDAWALIALLGGTLGIATMLQDVVRQSMIRELAFFTPQQRSKAFSFHVQLSPTGYFWSRVGDVCSRHCYSTFVAIVGNSKGYVGCC